MAAVLLMAGCSSSDGKNPGAGGQTSVGSGGNASTAGAAGTSAVTSGGSAGSSVSAGGKSSMGATGGMSQGGTSVAIGGATNGGTSTAAGGTVTVVGGSAGASMLGGAAGKATGPGFPDLAKPDCVTCLASCNDEEIGYTTAAHPIMPACANVSGVATDGPGAGVAKKQLCEALFNCMDRTRCSLVPNLPDPLPDPYVTPVGSAQQCYCGSSDGSACLGGAANGVCKDEFEAAYETSAAVTILINLTATADYAGASASALVECSIQLCLEKCFTR